MTEHERELCVVIVDDDPHILTLLARVVARVAPRATILAVGSVSAGREILLGSNPVDLLLVDYRLPDGDGTELAVMRAGLPHRPYTMLISATPPLVPGEGVDECLHKPFDIGTLEQKLRMFT